MQPSLIRAQPSTRSHISSSSDEALGKAEASNKTRVMFRAIYKAASATTKIESIDGTSVMSKPFAVNRGVIQGDITSPIYFTLALELILKRYDVNPHRGVQFQGQQVHTLGYGYADDAALLDDNIDVAADRVSSIVFGSTRDADMQINTDKTEVMHVVEQGRVSQATTTEARAKLSTSTLIPAHHMTDVTKCSTMSTAAKSMQASANTEITSR